MTSMINTNTFFRFDWFSGTGNTAPWPWSIVTCWSMAGRNSRSASVAKSTSWAVLVTDTPLCNRPTLTSRPDPRCLRLALPVLSPRVSMVHVGGIRCVTSSTDNIMQIHARITLTVECIRTCIFIFLLYVSIQLRVWSILTFFSILLSAYTNHAAKVAAGIVSDKYGLRCLRYVKCCTGGIRCVPSSTVHTLKIHGSLWLLHVYEPVFFICLFDVSIQGRYKDE